jgi:hypothetical protein
MSPDVMPRGYHLASVTRGDHVNAYRFFTGLRV